MSLGLHPRYTVGVPAFNPASLPGFLWQWDSKATSYFSDVAGTTPVSTDGASIRRATASGNVVLTTTSGNPMVLRVESGVKVMESAAGGVNKIQYTDSGNVTGYTFYLVNRPRVRTGANYMMGLGSYAAGTSLGIISQQIINNVYRWEGGAQPSNNQSAQVPDSTTKYRVSAGTWGDTGGGVMKIRLYADGILFGEDTGAAGPLAKGQTAFGDLGTSVDQRYAYFAVFTAFHTPAQIRQMTAYLMGRFPELFGTYKTDKIAVWIGASNLSESNVGYNLSVPNKVLAASSVYARDYLLTVPGATIDTLAPLVSDNIGRVRSVLNRSGKTVYCYNAGGGNDLRNLSYTTAQYLAKWEAAADAIRANDPQAYILALPILPGDGYTLSRRTDLNAAIRANANGKFNAVANWDLDSNIGLDGCNTNQTYYQSDNRHLNSTGTAYAQGLLQPFVEAGLS